MTHWPTFPIHLAELCIPETWDFVCFTDLFCLAFVTETIRRVTLRIKMKCALLFGIASVFLFNCVSVIHHDRIVCFFFFFNGSVFCKVFFLPLSYYKEKWAVYIYAVISNQCCFFACCRPGVKARGRHNGSVRKRHLLPVLNHLLYRKA